jgi:MFS family permease
MGPWQHGRGSIIPQPVFFFFFFFQLKINQFFFFFSPFPPHITSHHMLEPRDPPEAATDKEALHSLVGDIPDAPRNREIEKMETGEFPASTAAQRRRNVALIIAFTFGNAVVTSVVQGPLWSAWLFLRTGTAQHVGLVAGASGIVQLLAAFPVARASRTVRTRVLRGGALVSLAAALACVLAVTTGSIAVAYAFAVLYGLGTIASSVPLESLLADSVPPPRAATFARKWAFMCIGRIVGPAASIALIGEDTWETRQLEAALIAGALVTVVPAALLFLMADVNGAGEGTEMLPVPAGGDDPAASQILQDPSVATTPPPLSSQSANETGDDGDGRGKDDDHHNQGHHSDGHTARAARNDLAAAEPQGLLTRAPIFLAAGDLTVAMGAGLSVAFFPLFFQDLGVSPVGVSIIYAATPAATAIATFLTRGLASQIGRIQAIVVTNLAGTACLVALALSTTVRTAVFVHIVRTAVMNSTDPIRRSVMMDAVRVADRSRFNALEAFTNFTWAGSAAIGGLLHSLGYRTLFLITASFYFTGTAIESPLAAVVPVDDSVPIRRGAVLPQAIAALARWIPGTATRRARHYAAVAGDRGVGREGQ